MEYDTILLVMKNLVHFQKKYKKNIATDLRKKGFSYAEIRQKLHVPKSTLSLWLKKVKLESEQLERLQKKRSDIARKNSADRVQRTRDMLEEIAVRSARDIKDISKRELWLMGLMLYWRERAVSENESDMKKGVHLASSDPWTIKLFLQWLSDVGGIERDDIVFDIFIPKSRSAYINSVMDYWAEVTGFSRKHITHVYLQKKKEPKKQKRVTQRHGRFGLLRVRVKASSMLARQITGWVRGVHIFYWKDQIQKIEK